jgi:hypothetical protein
VRVFVGVQTVCKTKVTCAVLLTARPTFLWEKKRIQRKKKGKISFLFAFIFLIFFLLIKKEKKLQRKMLRASLTPLQIKQHKRDNMMTLLRFEMDTLLRSLPQIEKATGASWTNSLDLFRTPASCDSAPQLALLGLHHRLQRDVVTLLRGAALDASMNEALMKTETTASDAHIPIIFDSPSLVCEDVDIAALSKIEDEVADELAKSLTYNRDFFYDRVLRWVRSIYPATEKRRNASSSIANDHSGAEEGFRFRPLAPPRATAELSGRLATTDKARAANLELTYVACVRAERDARHRVAMMSRFFARLLRFSYVFCTLTQTIDATLFRDTADETSSTSTVLQCVDMYPVLCRFMCEDRALTAPGGDAEFEQFARSPTRRVSTREILLASVPVRMLFSKDRATYHRLLDERRKMDAELYTPPATASLPAQKRSRRTAIGSVFDASDSLFKEGFELLSPEVQVLLEKKTANMHLRWMRAMPLPPSFVISLLVDEGCLDEARRLRVFMSRHSGDSSTTTAIVALRIDRRPASSTTLVRLLDIYKTLSGLRQALAEQFGVPAEVDDEKKEFPAPPRVAPDDSASLSSPILLRILEAFSRDTLVLGRVHSRYAYIVMPEFLLALCRAVALRDQADRQRCWRSPSSVLVPGRRNAVGRSTLSECSQGVPAMLLVVRALAFSQSTPFFSSSSIGGGDSWPTFVAEYWSHVATEMFVGAQHYAPPFSITSSASAKSSLVSQHRPCAPADFVGNRDSWRLAFVTRCLQRQLGVVDDTPDDATPLTELDERVDAAYARADRMRTEERERRRTPGIDAAKVHGTTQAHLRGFLDAALATSRVRYMSPKCLQLLWRVFSLPAFPSELRDRVPDLYAVVAMYARVHELQINGLTLAMELGDKREPLRPLVFYQKNAEIRNEFRQPFVVTGSNFTSSAVSWTPTPVDALEAAYIAKACVSLDLLKVADYTANFSESASAQAASCDFAERDVATNALMEFFVLLESLDPTILGDEYAEIYWKLVRGVSIWQQAAPDVALFDRTTRKCFSDVTNDDTDVATTSFDRLRAEFLHDLGVKSATQSADIDAFMRAHFDRMAWKPSSTSTVPPATASMLARVAIRAWWWSSSLPADVDAEKSLHRRVDALCDRALADPTKTFLIGGHTTTTPKVDDDATSTKRAKKTKPPKPAVEPVYFDASFPLYMANSDNESLPPPPADPDRSAQLIDVLVHYGLTYLPKNATCVDSTSPLRSSSSSSIGGGSDTYTKAVWDNLWKTASPSSAQSSPSTTPPPPPPPQPQFSNGVRPRDELDHRVDQLILKQRVQRADDSNRSFDGRSATQWMSLFDEIKETESRSASKPNGSVPSWVAREIISRHVKYDPRKSSI